MWPEHRLFALFYTGFQDRLLASPAPVAGQRNTYQERCNNGLFHVIRRIIMERIEPLFASAFCPLPRCGSASRRLC
jgi:hypothetical protein